jgi:Ni/Co efflux regulator RcnB
MRIFALAAVAAAMTLAASPADAQRYPSRPAGPVAGAPMPAAPNAGGWRGGNTGGSRWNGGSWSGSRPTQPVRGPSRGGRWGQRINGYWYAGVQAPGGWKGYRQMHRGRTLPRYWISPSFFIGDFGSYGLQAPLPGYYWTRYYNDAVMIDRYGHVYDSVGGIDWDRFGGYDDGYAEGADYGEPDAPGYGAGYPPPPPGGPGFAPGGYPPAFGGSSSTYYSSSSTGGYAGPGYPGPRGGAYVVAPGTVATVTIPGAVTTTTTTEEYIEEYAPRPTVVVKRVYRRAAPKRVWRPKPKPRCGCAS